MNAVRYLLEELAEWIDAIAASIPGRAGVLLRRLLVGYRLKSAGSHLRIGRRCVFSGLSSVAIGSNVSFLGGDYLQAHNGGEIRIGNNVSINTNVMINAAEDGFIEIGDNCMIASNVVVRASNHRFDLIDQPMNEQGHLAGKISIRSDVWIGANAVILPNVTIGTGSVIAAGAVVTKDIEEYSVYAGVPARMIRKRLGGD